MKNKLFGIFNFTKEGKGIKKETYVEDTPFTFSTFFKTFGRNFWGFTCLNFLYLLVNFPVFFGIFALSGNLNMTSSAPVNLFYPQLFGMMNIKPSPFLQMHFGHIYGETSVSVPTTATLVFFAITALAIFTFGTANCGMANILRSYTRKEPVFLTTDFFDTIRTNWKQALPMGVIDILICFVLVFVFDFWKNYASSFINDIMFYLSIFVIIVYFFMRFYMYVIMITFDLSIFKILKNSFIFALIGVKRNFVALLSIAFVLLLNYYVFIVFMPLGIILPFIITISLCSFIAVYCTYPNIKRIMIDPYYPESPSSDYDDDDDEPVFVDRG